MSLESSYRRLLGVYPRSWRVQHGDELLALLLDAGEARQSTRASAADAVDLVAHGLAERARVTRHILAPDDVLGWAAFFSLSSAAALAGVFELRAELIVGFLPPWTGHFTHVGPMWTLAGFVYPLFVMACLAFVARRDRLARVLAGVASGLMASIVPVSRLLGLDRPPLWVVAAFVSMGALGAATRARGPRAGAIAMGAVVAAALLLLVGWRFTVPTDSGTYPASFLFYRFDLRLSTWIVDVTGGVGDVLLILAFARPRAWALGLLVAGLPWFALGVAPLTRQGLRGATNDPELVFMVLAPLIAWVAINIEVRLRRTAGRRRRADL